MGNIEIWIVFSLDFFKIKRLKFDWKLDLKFKLQECVTFSFSNFFQYDDIIT